MAKFYKYVVKPKGGLVLSFPLDMLRYDWAFPATTEDAFKLHELLRKTTPPGVHPFVTLISTKRPTGDRWESFSWPIDGKVQVIHG